MTNVKLFKPKKNSIGVFNDKGLAIEKIETIKDTDGILVTYKDGTKTIYENYNVTIESVFGTKEKFLDELSNFNLLDCLLAQTSDKIKLNDIIYDSKDFFVADTSILKLGLPTPKYIEPSYAKIFDFEGYKVGLCSDSFDKQDCNGSFTLNNLIPGEKYEISLGIMAAMTIDDDSESDDYSYDYIEVQLDKTYKYARGDNSHQSYLKNENGDIVSTGQLYDNELPNQTHRDTFKSTIWTGDNALKIQFTASTETIDCNLHFVANQDYKDEAWAYVLNSMKIEYKGANLGNKDPFKDESQKLALMIKGGKVRDVSGNYINFKVNNVNLDGNRMDFGDTQQTTNYVLLDSFNLKSNVTFETTVNFKDFNSGYDTIISIDDSDVDNRMMFYYKKDKTTLGIDMNGNVNSKQGHILKDDLTLDKNKDYNFVVIQNGDNTKVYLNGEKIVDKTTEKLEASSNSCLVLGQEQDSKGGDFDKAQCLLGTIKEFRYFDRPLIEDEVLKLEEFDNIFKQFVITPNGKFSNIKKVNL